MYVRIDLPLKIAINNQILKTFTPFAVIFLQQRLSSPVVDWSFLFFLIRFNKRREWFEMAGYNAILTHLLANIWYSTHNHKIPYHFLVFFSWDRNFEFPLRSLCFLCRELLVFVFENSWYLLLLTNPPKFFGSFLFSGFFFVISIDFPTVNFPPFSAISVLFVVDVLWISLAR